MRTSIAYAILFSTMLILPNYMWAAAQQDQVQPCVPSPMPGGETLPSKTSLTVEVCSTYSYKAQDGTTVVLGEIQNNNDFPITNAKVGVSFEDLNNNVLEYKTGTTLLQVVQPGSRAPFSISSSKPDPSITQVSVNLAGFTSASTKGQLLYLSPGQLQVSDKLTLSGMIKNDGTAGATHIRIYLVAYDAFQRVVSVGSSVISDIGAGNSANFTVDSMSNSRAKSYVVVAESDNYQSKPVPVSKIFASLPVVISNTVVSSPSGNSYSTIPVYAPVKISSKLNYISDKLPQPYVYYVQIKQFDGKVAFIGKSEGVFITSGDENQSISWTPTTAGSFFIETYVWDSDKVPLASAGTTINIVLVK